MARRYLQELRAPASRTGGEGSRALLPGGSGRTRVSSHGRAQPPSRSNWSSRPAVKPQTNSPPTSKPGTDEAGRMRTRKRLPGRPAPRRDDRDPGPPRRRRRARPRAERSTRPAPASRRTRTAAGTARAVVDDVRRWTGRARPPPPPRAGRSPPRAVVARVGGTAREGDLAGVRAHARGPLDEQHAGPSAVSANSHQHRRPGGRCRRRRAGTAMMSCAPDRPRGRRRAAPASPADAPPNRRASVQRLRSLRAGLDQLRGHDRIGRPLAVGRAQRAPSRRPRRPGVGNGRPAGRARSPDARGSSSPSAGSARRDLLDLDRVGPRSSSRSAGPAGRSACRR